MKRQAKGRGIILKKVAYGESDLILTLIMETGDRRSLLARGARKSQKRFAGGILDPTSCVQVGFAESTRGAQLATLAEAQQVESFEGLRTSYARLELALGFVNIVDKVCQEGDIGGAELFNILGNALRAAQTATSLTRLELQFKIKILQQQGSLHYEEWMEPYLRHSLRDSDKVEDTDDLSAKNLLIRGNMQDYLSGVHAGGHT